MIRIEKIYFPAANLGEENPLPDIKNISYIHAGYEVTEAITEEEKAYIGHGMIPTMLPYFQQDAYDRARDVRAFDAAILENDRLRAVFLPELGGRLWSLFDKEKNRELLYVNPVFQPGNLALRNAWFSGGVEFNVGIKGHNPLTCSPLHYCIDKTPEGDVLRLYEYERIRGVVYSISAYLPDDSAALYIRPRIENCTDDEKHMYWWSNIAVPETKGTRVIVPAEETFLCFYNADHYTLDKTSVPNHEGIDISYPSNIPSSRDFFYKIPKETAKWIASADENGHGLLQCSTRELIGRKLFVWGQGQGGRHWNEWLSEEGSAYIEIQAGLAHTQLEHIPMPARSVWEWTEAYTALDGDPSILHGDYPTAVKAVDAYMRERLGDPNHLAFPKDENVTESKQIGLGSAWGALEETARGERISKTLSFPAIKDRETAPFYQLLREGSFPCPSPEDAPTSYVTGKFWIERLGKIQEQNWYSLLILGVAYYADGELKKAEDAWKASIDKCDSAWAERNLAVLYRNEYGQNEESHKYILQAFHLQPNSRALVKDLGAILTSDGKDQLFLDLYDEFPTALSSLGRIRLYRAVALLHLDRLEEAAEIINEHFILPDIKEGELSVSHIWFELYCRIYAKEQGVSYDETNEKLKREADEKYPLPKALDFRMH